MNQGVSPHQAIGFSRNARSGRSWAKPIVMASVATGGSSVMVFSFSVSVSATPASASIVRGLD